MKKDKRCPVIAGNWKMNKNAQETSALIEKMGQVVKAQGCKVLLCVPFINIPCAVEAAKGSCIEIGAQNCHWEKSGAFTGEISADMLKSFGIKYAIIGHSERRQYFGESDESVNKRAKACLANGISPIICVGENLSQRENNITNDIIKVQITNALCEISGKDMGDVIIAYEPIWAIGTGKTASSEQAQEICCYIRSLVCKLYGDEIAQGLTIQYGGSMNAANAKELLSMEDIDGGLIGGASLKAEDFAQIVAAAN
ncbi:MAG: triose-phosphate isomerase [Oscillospiraceae bacterium]